MDCKCGFIRGSIFGAAVASAILLWGPLPAHAAETWVDLSTTSLHAGGNAGYNSNNFGLGVSRQWGDKFVMAGRYSNSLGTPSRYLLAGWTPLHVLGADIGAVAGALDGYDTMRNGKPFLAAAGIVRWSGQRFGAQLLLLPPIKGHVDYDADGGYTTHKSKPAAIGLQLRWRLK